MIRSAKDDRLDPYDHLMELIPDGETVYQPGGIQGRCDGRKSILLPTTKRLMICRLGFLGIKKDIDDYSWAKFDHVRISESWASSTLVLKFRRQDRVLKIEGVERAGGRLLYKRIRERISRYDTRFQISSKICPECGETINLVARRCPHCQHEFESDSA